MVHEFFRYNISMKKTLLAVFWSVLGVIFPKKPSVLELEVLVKNGNLKTLPTSRLLPHPLMFALFHYKDARVRALVWQIKFASNKILIEGVSELIAEEILSYIDEHGSFGVKEWMLIPIPATKKHKQEKGFNQTELLCKGIMHAGLNSFVSYEPDCLIKKRDTTPQVEVRNRSERVKNLIGAYMVIDSEKVSGKNIILIDDVITTGSTITEARRALKEAGAQKVVAFAVGH